MRAHPEPADPVDPPGAAARRSAFALLRAVVVLGRPLDLEIDRQLAGLPPRDRALARALVSHVLRHQPGLDSLIDSVCQRPLPADSRARLALQIALAGRLLLDTPPHAAIATILPLLEGGPRRLVHGVLSTLFRTDAQLPPPSLPGNWDARWRATWGDAAADAAIAAFAAIPPTDLCMKPGAMPGWAQEAGALSLFDGHVRLPGSQAIETLPGFAQGEWWVQDAAAQLPARLLGQVRGLHVLDLCAAPGGKTMQLAAAGADVTALDISAARMARVAANLARTGLSAEMVVSDAQHFVADTPFDAVLLDAPCSATGIFRRSPDVLYGKAGLDLAPLVAMQAALRALAATLLKPGGRLVYAVCSLEPAEGEAHPCPDGLIADPIAADELPGGLLPTGAGTVRTLPGLWSDQGGADGFFISRYRKPA